MCCKFGSSPIFFFYIHQRSLLAWDLERRVWRKWSILGIPVQPEKSHSCRNGCWTCRWELDDVQRDQSRVRFMCRSLPESFIHITTALMDRLLLPKWHQLRMPLLQSWLPIGSRLSFLATQIDTDYLVRLSGLHTRTIHALFYSKAQALQRPWAVVS